jgi:hypothetical protein
MYVGCTIHDEIDIEREEPFFTFLMSTQVLLEQLDNNYPIETDETYKLVYEGYHVTGIGRSDVDRRFDIRYVL